ncbi:cation transporter [bacterium]|nr:cation transporter [bacterium]
MSKVKNIDKRKKFVAGLSILSNVTLTALKILAGIISGSMSVISEAIHSLSDCLASVLTFFSVIKSSQPADEDHPYGHGKYEDMAGFIEGLLIIFAALFIFYKSFQKLIFGFSYSAENNLGIIVMALAVVMNSVVSYLLFKVAKESNSVSLYADGEHLRTDIYSSLGVLAALVLIKITGYTILDPVIAIMIAGFIYKAGYAISKKSFTKLLDHSLPENEMSAIKDILKEFSDEVSLKQNGIKARQIGPTMDIDLILQFPCDTSICECHKICDKIEKRIQKLYSRCSISIHSEPICYSKNCQKNCTK